MEIAIIGNINATNSIIEEFLISEFDAEISYFTYQEVADHSKRINSKSFQLIIFDLNTVTSGHEKAPSKIKTIAQQFDDSPILVILTYHLNTLLKPLKDAGAMGLIADTPTKDIVTKAVVHLLDGKEFIHQPQ